jgi:beta-glucosidase
VAQLLGYRRVHLDPGETVVVEFVVPPARLAFTDRRGERVVEPGELKLWVGPSCAEPETEASVDLAGAVHRVGAADERWTSTTLR